jgi:hypothetical protein
VKPPELPASSGGIKARAAAGAPAKANKELALMSTICHYAVREGVMELNPFTGMMLNRYDKDVRVVTRRQILLLLVVIASGAEDSQLGVCDDVHLPDRIPRC